MSGHGRGFPSISSQSAGVKIHLVECQNLEAYLTMSVRQCQVTHMSMISEKLYIIFGIFIKSQQILNVCSERFFH